MLCFILHVTDAESFPKPLTKKEEAEAIDRLAQGDEEAKKLLIERNLRLVAHIIKKYYSNYSEQDDLISIGTIGLIKGINSFNNNHILIIKIPFCKVLFKCQTATTSIFVIENHLHSRNIPKR